MSAQIRRLPLEGVLEIIPPRFTDERGFFSETWNAAALEQHGICLQFVQDNHSHSSTAGVIRGLHYQLPPFEQDKLVRVPRGAIFDVAVDLRRERGTFGQWVGLEVSQSKWNQLLVPRGFAHGFLVLEPDTEVIYKVTAPYSPQHERSIRFDDPDLAIAWPIGEAEIVLSDKDRDAPPFSLVTVPEYLS
ncbi:dTDP-4-dehydrorhamnose 3,5-epimerase [Pelagibacterium sp. H642]|uniref:dTDP-4-dehydrorhamnose 3,5-epimerase n=1 Tax=Pelagibacterium sp. H642 TaxID=1881069 RepID=UPI0028149B6E|nr:dTDP-4-dehydrorhamnose 3,5-epimerase [Pelagibacterium sp. H642]WMT92844.1 dTDP-4-dehydrorhamnose 3,5-epimerase [Pelagibacterium sp. H642]